MYKSNQIEFAKLYFVIAVMNWFAATNLFNNYPKHTQETLKDWFMATNILDDKVFVKVSRMNKSELTECKSLGNYFSHLR